MIVYIFRHKLHSYAIVCIKSTARKLGADSALVCCLRVLQLQHTSIRPAAALEATNNTTPGTGGTGSAGRCCAGAGVYNNSDLVKSRARIVSPTDVLCAEPMVELIRRVNIPEYTEYADGTEGCQCRQSNLVD